MRKDKRRSEGRKEKRTILEPSLQDQNDTASTPPEPSYPRKPPMGATGGDALRPQGAIKRGSQDEQSGTASERRARESPNVHTQHQYKNRPTGTTARAGLKEDNKNTNPSIFRSSRQTIQLSIEPHSGRERSHEARETNEKDQRWRNKVGARTSRRTHLTFATNQGWFPHTMKTTMHANCTRPHCHRRP